MGKLSELAHWLWIEARFQSPSFVQRTIMPRLHKVKEYARLVAEPYMTLYELKGRNQAGPLTVTYGGLGYARLLLESLLFTEEPVEREIARVPVWRPGELVSASTGDLTIIESSKYLINKLPGQGAITLPFRVRFILDVRGAWEEVEQRFRSDARRNDMRKAKNFGYTYEISHKESDLEMFYQDMYLPTMMKRHGDLADLLPKREAYQFLRHGQLFLTKRDGVYVSGGLCLVQQGILGFKEMGVLNGDEQLMREGAVGAMNYLRMYWAHEQGYRGVNLGTCWPFLSGGFRNKRKWGAAVSVPPNEHKQIWISVQHNTPAVAHFLSSNPCVIVDGMQRLNGLFVTDDLKDVTSKTEKRWHKLYATPGLSDLLVRSVAELRKEPAS
jgi:hypothetical protein